MGKDKNKQFVFRRINGRVVRIPITKNAVTSERRKVIERGAVNLFEGAAIAGGTLYADSKFKVMHKSFSSMSKRSIKKFKVGENVIKASFKPKRFMLAKGLAAPLAMGGLIYYGALKSVIGALQLGESFSNEKVDAETARRLRKEFIKKRSKK